MSVLYKKDPSGMKNPDSPRVMANTVEKQQAAEDENPPKFTVQFC